MLERRRLPAAERIAAFDERTKQHARDHRPDAQAWTWVDREDFKVFWNAPAVAVISRPVEDCCRAGQTLLLATHDRGLGACWVGAPMLWLRTPQAKAEIGIPPDLTPVSAICIGYAGVAPHGEPRARPRVIWMG